MTSIVVVRIDHRKRSIHLINGAQYRMCGSPWLHTSFRYLKSLRNIVEILEHIGNVHDLFHPLSYRLFKIRLVFFFDNKYHFLKSGTFRIEDRKVHNNMSLFVNRIDLFQPSISASHSCCHNH